MGGLDPLGKKKLPTSDDLKNGMKLSRLSLSLMILQAVFIGSSPAFLQNFKEQALGYVSVAGSDSLSNTISMIGLVYWVTVFGMLSYLLVASVQVKNKTPHALLTVFVCGAAFAFTNHVFNGDADEVWVEKVRASPGPCQDFFKAYKSLGKDGSSKSFWVGACMAEVQPFEKN